MIDFGLRFGIDNQATAEIQRIRSYFVDLTSQMSRLEQQSNRARLSMHFGRDLMQIGSFILSPLVKAAEVAAKFSDLMADVQKTTGLLPQNIRQLSKELQGIDTRTSMEGLFDIAKIGGSIGVGQLNEAAIKKGGITAQREYQRATMEVASFTKAIDMANVALGDEIKGGPEAIAKRLGGLKMLFAETKNMDYGEAMTRIGSAINYLGATGLSTGQYLTNFSARLGQINTIVPLSGSEIMGLGAVFEELRLGAESGSSGLSRVFTVMGKSYESISKQIGMSVEQYKQLYATKPNELLLKFAESLKQFKGVDLQNKLAEFGINGVYAKNAIAALAGNIDLVRDKQAKATRELEKGTSAYDEFNIKNQTLAATYEKLKRNVEIFYLTLGETNLFSPIVSFFNDLVNFATKFIQTNLGQFVIYLVGAFGALIVVMAALTYLRAGMIYFVVTMKILAIESYKTLIAIAPYAIVLLSIAGAITFLYQSFQAFNDVLEGTAKVSGGLTGAMQKIGGVIYGIAEAWNTFDSKKGEFAFSEKLLQTLDKLGIKNFVLNLGYWVARIKMFLIGMYEGFKDVFKAIFGIVKALATPIVWAIGKMFEGFERMGLIKMDNKLNAWAIAGKELAYIIGGVLLLAFINLAVAVVTATYPLLIIIALIVLVGLVISNWDGIITYVGFLFLQLWEAIKYGVMQVAGFFVWLGVSIYEGIGNGLLWIWEALTGFFNNIGTFFYDIGANIVASIQEGISSVWADFVGWFQDMMNQIPGADWFIGGVEGNTQTGSLPNRTMPNDIAALMSERAKLGANSANYVLNNQFSPNMNVQPSPVVVNLDGRVIAEVVNSQNKSKFNRN